ncbi:alpha/beta fold hydrolase [Spirulina major]|uniref:alpha/beta fold hydrolase n=1 Tax=Spirulina major TaxID=270636 RepID=UPI0009344844|nr:alpha/beta fold hydrolase [Spirulina major]
MTLPLPLDTPAATWHWHDLPICYQQVGDRGPAVVLIHGFGASWGHWRHTLPVLGMDCRCYAIDLLGFGGSAKPTPGQPLSYTFATWAQQIADFCDQVVGEAAFLIGNSIGAIVAMQTAVSFSDRVLGVAALNFSLRLLHERHRATQPWHQRLSVPLLQSLLKQSWFSTFFFQLAAQPQNVRRALLQAYRRPEAVTDELVTMLLKPAADPGAAAVFAAFTTYSQGPLPEDLLPHLPCPAIVLWGEADPWEPITLGRQLVEAAAIEEFIPLPNVGHCPQDEAPELVNPILQAWLARHAPPIHTP